jgi:drug/metabolite transporter (DMT)-like permease
LRSLKSRRPLTQTGKGYLIAVVGVAVWSATATMIGYISKRYGLPPFVIATWRDAFACLILLAVLFLIKRSLLRLPRKHWGFVFLYGLLLSVFNSIWTISVALNGAAISTVLVYSSAAFTAIIAWPLFGERLTPVRLVAILFSLAGCALVAGALNPSAWSSNLLGVITGLASGLCFSTYSLMGKETARRGISSWTALMYTFGCTIISLQLHPAADWPNRPRQPVTYPKR